MRWMALGALGSALLCVALSAGCDDDESETAATGGGGAGAAGGAGGTTSGSGGNEPGCHGDADAWDAIEKESISCTKNSDCCVVFNPCTADGQVVGVSDFPTAADVWPWCDDECVFCAFPFIEVECVNQQCVGYEVEIGTDPPDELATPHCGEDDVVVGLPGPAMTFPCL